LQIDAHRLDAVSVQQVRRNQDRNIQSVFSEVLRAAGRPGYASAEIDEASASLPERIEQSWNQWYKIERLARYASPEAPRDLGETFGNVLREAYDAGAYVDPVSFLQKLSASDLKAVQSAHWLADPIQVDSLTEEGALNLLIPPAAQVDLNRDGLTQSGAAYGIRFPDSTTPANVATAWDNATADMPIQDRMIYELQMKMPVLLANIIIAPDCGFSHSRSPGDVDFVNPLAADDYSFIKVTQDWIGHLDYFKNQLDPFRYEKDRSFWSKFQQELQASGVA